MHRRLVRSLPSLAGPTFHDLYEAYPAFDIDVEREQRLLTAHEGIIFQHPLHWYSTPAILKQWEDLVLEHGWAYGSRGTALRGKWFLNVITAGGGATAYRAQKFLRHDEESVRELTRRRGDRAGYLGAAGTRIEQLERLLLADLEDRGSLERDAGWDAESLRDEVRQRALGDGAGASPAGG